jgi:hypothetical protein
VVSVLGGRYARVLPVRAALPAGQLLCAAGLLAMRGLEASSPWTVLLPGLLVMGVGIGLSNPAVTYAALGVVPATRSGMASGVSNTFRQVGIALGIAVLGILLPARIDGDPAAFADASAPHPPGQRRGRRRRGRAGRCSWSASATSWSTRSRPASRP